MRFIEVNDPKKIIDTAYESIPVVTVGKKKIYFVDDDLSAGISELKTVLEDRLAHTKPHSCADCGNCRCPEDQKQNEHNHGAFT